MRKIRDVLFDVSPYEGFNRSPYPVDMQGWGSDHPILTKAIELVRPTYMVEVGRRIIRKYSRSLRSIRTSK